MKSAHLRVAELRAELIFDLAENAQTVEERCSSPLAEPYQFRAGVSRVRYALKHAHDDEFIDELSGGLLGDTESTCEVGEARTLKIDVGQQRCVRGPNRFLRAIPYAPDGTLVQQARCFEEQLQSGVRFGALKTIRVRIARHSV